MKKRRTKINLGSSPAAHRAEANKLIRTANEWYLRSRAGKTCHVKLMALRHAVEEIGRAEEHFNATGLALGTQRKKARAALGLLQKKIYIDFDRFGKTCTTTFPDWSKDK